MQTNPYIDEQVPWPELPVEASCIEDAEDGSCTEPAQKGKKKNRVRPPTPQKALQQYWGYDSFRGIQEQIINSILAGHDTLGLMPTGGGKSITFQVPALMMKGTCIVITPLVALMKDQVVHLRERGIRATCIHSGLSRNDIIKEFDNCILGDYDFLYLSPERLHTDLFRQKLQHLSICFITVDEAHCISQWGYDFRPSYLQIKEIRQLLPHTPILALTATATPDVVTDITRQLNFGSDAQVFRMSFDRPNLDYRVVETDNKREAILHALQTTEGSAIVYVRSRSGTRDFAYYLEECGITASYYHAGLSSAEKDVRQEMWTQGEVRVMVATNAFGMGIDKADVRYVLHFGVPDSIEAYFQEAGRAGRDGKPAVATLFFSRSDRELMARRITQAFPPKEKIRCIYDDLAYYFQLAVGDGLGMRYELNLNDFCFRFRYYPDTVEAALRILQRGGYLTYNEDDDTKSRVMFIMRRDELYDVRLSNPLADRVLFALLRNYAALFSDYALIDETLLARECNCTEDDVYESLLGLTRLRVLHYKPRKQMASVTYMQRRVEHERIALLHEVYEDRLEQYIEQITAITHYLDDDVTPRAEQLLAYFGEELKSAGKQNHDNAEKADGKAEKKPSPLEAVQGLLADGDLHHPAEFHELPYPFDDVNEALLRLLDMGKVTIERGHFRNK